MIAPFRFHTTLRVRFNETDAQSHVNFSWYLNYFDVALIEYLRTLGYSYQQMLEEELDMLYIDAHAAYHSPAHFDEILQLHCRLGHVGNTSMKFEFQVYAASDERLVATGEITIVIVDRRTRAKMRVPDRLRQAVAAFETVSVVE